MIISSDTTTHLVQQLGTHDTLDAFERLEFLIDTVRKGVFGIIDKKKTIKVGVYGKRNKTVKIGLSKPTVRSSPELKKYFKAAIHQVIDAAQVGVKSKKISLTLEHLSTRYNKLNRDDFIEAYKSKELEKDLRMVLSIMYFVSAHGEKAMKSRTKESIKTPESQSYASSYSNRVLKVLLLRSKKELSGKQYDALKKDLVDFVDDLTKKFPMK